MSTTSTSTLLRKKEAFTLHHPIPSFIPQNVAISILQDHTEIITLNPLVTSHYQIPPPQFAPTNEFYNSSWYSITERIQYVPGLGRMGSGKISFQGCFRDTTIGVWTHIYAPMGVDLKVDYRVDASKTGGIFGNEVVLSADVEIECNITLISFVKSQLKDSLKEMVDRMIKRASLLDASTVKEICGEQMEYNRSQSWQLGHGQPQAQKHNQRQDLNLTRDSRQTRQHDPIQSRDHDQIWNRQYRNHSQDRSQPQLAQQPTEPTNEVVLQTPLPSDYVLQPRTTQYHTFTGTTPISRGPSLFELPTHTITIKRQKSNDSISSIYSIYSRNQSTNSDRDYATKSIPTIEPPTTSQTSPPPSCSSSSNTSNTSCSKFTSYKPYMAYKLLPISSPSTSRNSNLNIPLQLTPGAGRRSSSPQIHSYIPYPGASRRPVSIGVGMAVSDGNLGLRSRVA